VLAICLHRAGYRIDEVIARAETVSQKRARKIAKAVHARAASYTNASFHADVFWICVTDDAVTPAARTLARGRSWRGKTVFHSSGALPSSAIAPLQKKGASIASVHPMNTFVASTKPDLRGTPFSIEGDRKAMLTGERIAHDLAVEGYVFRIHPEHKVLYHAMGSFASPLFVSLVGMAEAVGRAAGIRRPEQVFRGILRRTMENYLARGAAAAFSGPINRGDVTTVRKHLRALRRVPNAAELYRSLAKNAVKNFPVKNRRRLEKLLK
jgi:predicted short-subunit dehydrogenase-like oxidoreductase (DUF2520 family)